MGPTGLRERKKHLTHEAIINAALDLFERQGFEETTIEEIAEAAGISPRTLFRYFESKTALIIDHEDHDAGGKDEFTAMLVARPPEESPVDALHHVIRDALVPMLTTDATQLVRRFRVAMRTPSLRLQLAEHMRAHQVDMVHAFAIRLGTSDDDLAPRVTAAALTETLFAVIERWVAGDADPGQLPALVDEAFELVRSGFAQPATDHRARRSRRRD